MIGVGVGEDTSYPKTFFDVIYKVGVGSDESLCLISITVPKLTDIKRRNEYRTISFMRHTLKYF